MHRSITPTNISAKLQCFHFLLGGDAKHEELWGEIKDRYFLNLLDVGLNKIPSCSKPIDELSDKEYDAWIKESLLTTNDEASREASYQIDIPQLEREFPLMGKSEYLILPLSLENNSTLTVPASILEQFSRGFKIPCKHASRHFVFDETNKCYDLASARKHHELMIMLFNRRKNSLVIDEQIRSTEKTIVDESNESRGDEDVETNEIPAETIESTTRFFQQQGGKLIKLYNRINNNMITAMQSRDNEQLNKLVKKLQDTQEDWENVADHLSRNILYYIMRWNIIISP
jgi:hypothetical protein